MSDLKYRHLPFVSVSDLAWYHAYCNKRQSFIISKKSLRNISTCVYTTNIRHQVVKLLPDLDYYRELCNEHRCIYFFPFYFWFVYGPYSVLLSFLVLLVDHEMPGIDRRPASCQANAIPVVLSPQPIYIFLWNKYIYRYFCEIIF